MILARVAGQVVGTENADRVDRGVYLLLEEYSAEKPATGRYLVALDIMGAGDGEIVLVSQGSSARQTDTTKEKAIDAVVIGIVDEIDSVKGPLYRKYEN